jgi:hypothetical protein
LNPGDSKSIRGKIYIVRNNVEDLLHRCERDFSAHLEKN